MANISSSPLIVSIVGDNTSRSCVIYLNFTPVTATATAAYDSTQNSVLANIASVVPASQQVTIQFVAPFSGTIQVVLALSSSSPSTPVTIMMGSDGAHQPRSIAADAIGALIVSDYQGLANIFLLMLYEIRALKYAVIKSATAEVLDDDDFKASNFVDPDSRSL
jgi:hypothetical protein